MESLVENAIRTVNTAIANEMPPVLVRRCVGVVLIRLYEIGWVATACGGTGILLHKKNKNSTNDSDDKDKNYPIEWHPPVACSILGGGFPAAGISSKELLLFVYDEVTLSKLAHGTMIGVNLSAQSELTIGPLGRAHEVELHLASHGVGAVTSVAYSKGLMMAFMLKSSLMGVRFDINRAFYGSQHDGSENEAAESDASQQQAPATSFAATDILAGIVPIPSQHQNLLSRLFGKLNELGQCPTAISGSTQEGLV